MTSLSSIDELFIFAEGEKLLNLQGIEKLYLWGIAFHFFILGFLMFLISNVVTNVQESLIRFWQLRLNKNNRPLTVLLRLGILSPYICTVRNECHFQSGHILAWRGN